MFERLLPRRIDDTYRGQIAALWLFGILLFIRIGMSVNCIFNGYKVATNADGVPLATFTPDAVGAVVYLFAAWGLAQLMISSIGVLALVRYRSVVPMIFAILLIEAVSRKAIHYYLPVATVGSPPAFLVNLVLLTLMGSGLALSLWPRKQA